MTKNSRLKEERIKSGMSQEELAAKLGVNQAYIGNLESSKGFSLKKAIEIAEVIGADGRYIYYGPEGNNKVVKLVVNDHPEKNHEELTDQKFTSHPLVPMYNFPGAASGIEMYNDTHNDAKIVGHLSIPGATKNSFALPIYGHSMYPTLANGDWGVIRPIENPQDILWGEVYYIEWSDYRNYKRLLLGDNPDEVILWSDNQAEKIGDRAKYSPVTIKKEQIRRLCLLTDILKKPNY